MRYSLKPKTHLAFLDGIRAIAAVYVVMHHAMLHYSMDTSLLPRWQRRFMTLFSFGHYVVDLFIVLSGFSLMLAVVNKDYADFSITTFYKKRIKRILPPYYLALALSALLIFFCIGSASDTWWGQLSLPLTPGNLLSHLLLCNDVLTSHAYKINYSLWSVPVECRIYLFFPLLLWLWKKKGAFTTLLFAVSVSVLLFAVMKFSRTWNADFDLIVSGVNPYIILFTMGMLAAQVCFAEEQKVWVNKVPWLLCLIAAIAAFAFCKSRITLTEDVNGNIPTELLDVLFGVAGCCLLVVGAKDSYEAAPCSWLRKSLSWKPLVWIGTFSYSIYLIHAPLLQVVSEYLIKPLGIHGFAATFALITAGTVFVIALARVFYWFCERPFLNNKVSVAVSDVKVNELAKIVS